MLSKQADKVSLLGSLFPCVSTAFTSKVCFCPAFRLANFTVAGLSVAQLENALPSKLHSKTAIVLVLGVAVTWNVIEVETVKPSCSFSYR